MEQPSLRLVSVSSGTGRSRQSLILLLHLYHVVCKAGRIPPLILVLGSYLVCCAFLAGAPADDAQGRSEPTGLRLVWADEFESDGRPNPANWTFEEGFVRNRELQWYQPQNAKCEGGLLIIEGRREAGPSPWFVSGSPDWRKSRETRQYTSASLTTRGLHSWRYGRFEMKARIDTRPGLWPAFWTLGVRGRWPRGGEIDIMEYYQGTLLANLAWAGVEESKPRWNSIRKPIDEFGNPDWSKDFHVWRMDWSRDEIQLSVDDTVLNSTNLKSIARHDKKLAYAFHQPHYIIVNLAIGGDSGGDPSLTEFPAYLEVDYVRVYTKE